MRNKFVRVLMVVLFVVLVTVPVAAYFDHGGSGGGWLLPQATLCDFDHGGSGGG